jgi:hypothetical protein
MLVALLLLLLVLLLVGYRGLRVGLLGVGPVSPLVSVGRLTQLLRVFLIHPLIPGELEFSLLVIQQESMSQIIGISNRTVNF